jgi:hypothetical protein
MTKSLSPELKQAQQIAATAQVLAVIALVIITITIVFKVGGPITAALFGDAKPWREHVNTIGLVLIAMLPTFLFYESINQLRHALKLYGAGEFFSAAAASRVAQAGDYAIGAIVAMILVVPNLMLWVTKRGGFEWRFESELIGMLAFALFVAVVGRILAAATQLKTENDSFV